jgi:hypothetical protein
MREQGIQHRIEIERGGVWLMLTAEQYAKLAKHWPRGVLFRCAVATIADPASRQSPSILRRTMSR